MDSGERISSKFDFRKLQANFEGFEIKVGEGLSNNIQARSNVSVIYKDYPILIKDVSFFDSAIVDAAVTIADVSTKSLSVLTVLMLLFSVSFAVAMIKLYQVIFFLMFINVELPSNAGRMIETFKRSPLDYTPSIRQLFGGGGEAKGVAAGAARRSLLGEEVKENGSLVCLTHTKFDENGLKCSALDNVGKFVTQLMAFILIILIVVVLMCVLGWFKTRKKTSKHREQLKRIKRPSQLPIVVKKKRNKENEEENNGFVLKKLRKVDSALNISFFINFLKAIQLKAVLGVMVSLSSQDYRTQKMGSQVNLLVSTVTMILYTALLFS